MAVLKVLLAGEDGEEGALAHPKRGLADKASSCKAFHFPDTKCTLIYIW